MARLALHVRIGGSLMLLPLVLVVSGCGEEELTAEQYQAELTAIVADSAEANSLFLDVVTGGGADSEACARKLGRLRAEIDEIAGHLDTLNPPTEVEDAQARFIAAARQGAERLQEIEGMIEEGQSRCGRPMNELLIDLESRRAAEQAIADVESAGFIVFGE